MKESIKAVVDTIRRDVNFASSMLHVRRVYFCLLLRVCIGAGVVSIFLFDELSKYLCTQHIAVGFEVRCLDVCVGGVVLVASGCRAELCESLSRYHALCVVLLLVETESNSCNRI